jgi:hypothetical protein
MVFYAATEAGVQQSRDGRVWQNISEGLGQARPVSVVSGLRSDSRVLYAATNEGVFKTTDARTWTRMLSEPNVNSIVVDPSDDQRVYATASGRLWASTNSGFDWASVAVPFPSAVIAVDPFSSQRFYISATHNYDHTFATSSDRGVTWRTYGSFAPFPFIAVDPAIHGRLYTSMGALIQSNDYGQTWFDRGPNPRDLMGVLPEGAHFAEIRRVYAAAPGGQRPGDAYTCIEARWTQLENPEDISGPFIAGYINGWASLVSGLWAAGSFPDDRPCTAVVRLEAEDLTVYAVGTKVYSRAGLLGRRVDAIADLGSPIGSLIAVQSTE